MTDPQSLLDKIERAKSLDDLGSVGRFIESPEFDQIHQMDRDRVFNAYVKKIFEVSQVIGV